MATDKADNNSSDKVSSNGTKIEVGIERMQNLLTKELLHLVETEKYDHYDFVKEIGMYVRNTNGRPIDAYNHALDECRYGCNYFYRRYIA